MTYSAVLRPGLSTELSVEGLSKDSLDAWMDAHGVPGDRFTYCSVSADGTVIARVSGIVEVGNDARTVPAEVPKRTRLPLYWKTWRNIAPFLLIVMVLLIVNGSYGLAVALPLVCAALFFVPWLMSPFSKIAYRRQHPSDRAFERTRRVADWLGRIPVFGILWRFAERQSRSREITEDYRLWLRAQEKKQQQHDDA